MIDDTATVRIERENPGPLLVVLHGYGANERDLVPLLDHLPRELSAAFLRAPIGIGPRAWAWFPLTISPATGGLDGDATQVRDAAAQVRTWITAQAGGREVILLGFSQGGTTALEVARRNPADIRAVVALSAFVLTEQPAPPASIPIFFGHGQADQVVPPDLTEATSRWLAGSPLVIDRSYPGLPHAVDARELADIRDFLVDLA